MSDEHDKKVEEVKAILEAKGIRLYIWGCGCCDSPEVKLEVDGESIVDETNGFNFCIDMF